MFVNALMTQEKCLVRGNFFFNRYSVDPVLRFINLRQDLRVPTDYPKYFIICKNIYDAGNRI